VRVFPIRARKVSSSAGDFIVMVESAKATVGVQASLMRFAKEKLN
jgi:hypothetical protein